jgi:hypothetical protein
VAVLQAPSFEPSSRWSTTLVAQLEQQLATHVGPVASFLVRRATSQAQDVAQLRERLTRHFRTDAARGDFNELLIRLSADLANGRATESASSSRNSSIARLATQPPSPLPVTATLLQEVTRSLAAYLGPIAKVVTSRAAANARDIDDFMERITAAVPDPKDQDKLRRTLAAIRDQPPQEN